MSRAFAPNTIASGWISATNNKYAASRRTFVNCIYLIVSEASNSRGIRINMYCNQSVVFPVAVYFDVGGHCAYDF